MPSIASCRPASGGAIARSVSRRLERATGADTLGSMAEPFGSLESMLSHLRRRTARARSLLSSERSAFVLVTAPRPSVLEQTEALTRTARELGLPIAAVVFNRAHPVAEAFRGADAEREARALVASLRAGSGRDWLSRALERSLAIAEAQHREITGFSALHPDAVWAAVPELARDLHSLADLRALVPELSSATGASASARSAAAATRGP